MYLSNRSLFAGIINVYGHKLKLPAISLLPRDVSDLKSAKLDHVEKYSIARFKFAQLCDDAVGAADYKVSDV